VLAREGRLNEAAEEFRKAIDANPKFVPAYNNLAELLVQQGRLEEAETFYRRSLAEKPSASVTAALNAVLRKLGRPAEQLGKVNTPTPGR
jgi:tetratricopeptide (TPR) repeat protein